MLFIGLPGDKEPLTLYDVQRREAPERSFLVARLHIFSGLVHGLDHLVERNLDLTIHPVTLEIAQLAGKVEGEQAARGISIAFEDLLIGTTALHLGFAVATLNVRHFRLIPGLSVIQL